MEPSQENGEAPPALRMRGIRKSFPGVLALDGVDLDVRAGEVHVLLGENGAGKSTLMKILSGAQRCDAGTIELDGREVAISGPAHAQALGIRIIYQELNLVPQLSAAENIFLGCEPTLGLGFVDRARLEREAGEKLAALGVRVDAARPVQELGIAQQQMVEVAKALHGEARVLIMDEPTSALTASEIEVLFAAIQSLTARGVAIVYISHRLEEVERIGTRVSVLRDGRHVATHRVGDVSLAELVRLMANRELKEHFPNIQFIVTTHSPFVCQAADPKGLIRLPAPGENRTAEHVSGELYKTVVNGTVDEAALTELFGLEHVHSDRSEQLRERVAQLEAHVLEGAATPEDREELKRLSAQLPDTGSALVDRAVRKLGLDK